MVVKVAFQKVLILVTFIVLSFLNLGTSDCPSNSYTIPPVLGSAYSCVTLVEASHYFTQAELVCNNQSGHLLSIPNGYVNTIIADLIKDATGTTHNYWIGVTNMVGGVWRNVDDGSNATFFNWDSGYPHNGSQSSCVYMLSNGLWRSISCYPTTAYHLCTIPGIGETDSA